ncbi:MAG: spore germination protein [Bacillota bacterium]|nr:spore germination protein [Bacillota bacterium]
MRITKKLFSPKKKFTHPDQTTSPEIVPDGELKNISRVLEQNQTELERIFGKTVDMVLKEIHIGTQKGIICYLQSMTDAKLITEKIMEPLGNATTHDRHIFNKYEFSEFSKDFFSGLVYSFTDTFHQVALYILSGYAVLMVEGIPETLAIQIEGIETRSISESTTQTIIRGPKDAFNESISTNISLIRRRIKNPNLRFEGFTIGKDTQTSVVVAYIEGIANQKVIEEVRNRVSRVNINAIFDSGNIEELIGDKTYTPFPLVYNSERPDTIAAHLTAGKIAIFVDGSPFVLSVPVVLTNFFDVSEDYFQPFLMSSFIRLVRYASFLLSLLLPAIFVTLITYHFELIPTPLLVSIASQRENVPFPAIIELMLMDLTFEILREAGTRMPRAVGQTVSIVGALVIGQAAVEAGIISNMMIIVVAITAIASFVSPIYSFANSTRLLRFFLTMMGGILGLYGVLLGMCAIFAHLVSLRSFGVPYLAPMAPFIVEDQKDVLIRMPLFHMKGRPKFLNTESPINQPEIINPSPSKNRRPT